MIIGISGTKGSGKDTTANYIIDNYDCYSYALADAIKQTLCIALSKYQHDISIDDFYDEDFKEQIIIKNDPNLVLNVLSDALHVLYTKRANPLLNSAKIPYRILNKDHSIRTLMQNFGTDIVCNTDKLYWVKEMMLEVSNHKPRNIIVTDIRQDHELNYFRSLNAKMIFINKDTNKIDQHITEKGLPFDETDVIINNNGSKDQLYNQIEKLLCQMNIKKLSI